MDQHHTMDAVQNEGLTLVHIGKCSFSNLLLLVPLTVSLTDILSCLLTSLRTCLVLFRGQVHPYDSASLAYNMSNSPTVGDRPATIRGVRAEVT
jgi:hypothetical protein